ncbi:MAG: histidine kinase, partial [Acidobacteriaceae bacterium]|nr:histidine kinase [Acidobacteriaceae bacterium]
MSAAEQPLIGALHPGVSDLRSIPVFGDLPEEHLQWLAERMVLVEAAPGDVLFTAGSPADRMLVLFEGELSGESDSAGADNRYYVVRGGRVTGMLPFSRLTTFPLTVRATLPSRVSWLHKDYFPEMLSRMPVLQERLVAVLADRIREVTKADQEREKLVALGRLSAGLAHELNNPAAAAQRAASALGEAMDAFRTANLRLGKLDLSSETRQFLADFEYKWAKQAGAQPVLDTLERSEREEELGTWLDRRNVKDAWNLAATLVDAGCTLSTLETVARDIKPEFLSEAFTRLSVSVTISRLVEQIQSATSRISELVKSVKQYSYMDQTPVQEVDIHEGIDNTLIMLKHQLKSGIEVVRQYDRSLPKLTVRGSELNQVWTNLITNAIDAMKGKGRLEIRTCRNGQNAAVDVIDNGPGIPPEIRDRIFEPFFTTKAVNEGTGLGLDTVFRVVSRHHGNVRMESRPGE